MEQHKLRPNRETDPEMEKWDAQSYKLHGGEATLTGQKNESNSFGLTFFFSPQNGGPPTWLILECVACDVSVAVVRGIPVQGERVQTDAADSQ